MRRLRLGEGQRWWLREIAVVVIGVLIALGLGQVAEELHWRAEVAETRQEIRYELGDILEQARITAEYEPCINRRLDELGAVLATASETRRLPPLGPIGKAPIAIWSTDVWESQKAGQIAAHFPPDELAALSRAYRGAQLAALHDERERAAWVALNGMVGPGRPLDAITEGRLYAALTEARQENQVGRDIPVWLRESFDRDLGRGYARIRRRNPVVNRDEDRPVCRPIGTAVPPVYGRID